MPVRDFRTFINNATEDTRLHLVDSHLCSGSWTSSDWTPPHEILPRQQKGFQSESDGLFGLFETEGWVKYEAVDGRNNGVGQIMVYWSNPWWGVTQFSCSKSSGAIVAPCDDTTPSGSAFDAPPTSDIGFSLSAGFYGSQDAPDHNLLPAAIDILAIPWSMIGTAGIIAQAELIIEFTKNPPAQLFAPNSGTEALVPAVDADEKNWIGAWSGNSVNIKILQTIWGALQIAVTDSTTNPVLEFQDSFMVGDQNRLVKDSLGSVSLLTGKGSNHIVNSALGLAAFNALKGSSAAQNRSSKTLQVLAALVSAAENVSPELTIKGISRIARRIAEVHMKSRWVVWLSRGVGLELYWVTQGGSRIGARVHYQRILDSGLVAADVWLNWYPELR
jgi:hypothetical protein